MQLYMMHFTAALVTTWSGKAQSGTEPLAFLYTSKNKIYWLSYTVYVQEVQEHNPSYSIPDIHSQGFPLTSWCIDSLRHS